MGAAAEDRAGAEPTVGLMMPPLFSKGSVRRLLWPHPVCIVRPALPSFTTSAPKGIPGSGMRGNQAAWAGTPGPIKRGKPGAGLQTTTRSSAKPSARPWALLGVTGSMVRRHHPLPYLLLLPLGACFPLLDRKEPTDTVGGVGAGMSWAHQAQGDRPHLVWSPSWWPRAPHAQTLLVRAKGLQASGGEQAGVRLARQDDSEATGFLPADGEKASGPLGNLAEELNGYSRKKGGFSFRFGRR